MDYSYTLIRSGRKTLSLEISPECKIIVRAPTRASDEVINEFVNAHRVWIDKHIGRARARAELDTSITKDYLESLRVRASEYIKPRVERFASIMGVEPAAVKITAAKKRFGSCSGKNSLCFSCRLMMYPLPAVDYVIVHELAHIKHHNHSRDFYRLIEKYMPDYRERAAMLREIPSSDFAK